MRRAAAAVLVLTFVGAGSAGLLSVYVDASGTTQVGNMTLYPVNDTVFLSDNLTMKRSAPSGDMVNFTDQVNFTYNVPDGENNFYTMNATVYIKGAANVSSVLLDYGDGDGFEKCSSGSSGVYRCSVSENDPSVSKFRLKVNSTGQAGFKTGPNTHVTLAEVEN